MADIFARQRQLIGSTEEWAVNDIIIGLGEIGVEVVSSVDTRIKVGDGVTTWSALPYISATSTSINAATLEALAAQVSRSGDTMTGELLLHANPADALGATPKQYVDGIAVQLGDLIANRVQRSGDTMTGPLMLSAAPTDPAHAVQKSYVDAEISQYLPLSGSTMTGPILLHGAPTDGLEAVTKSYVDSGAYQSIVGGSAEYAGKVVKLNASGMLDTSIVPVSSTYVGPINITLSYNLTGSYTVGSYFTVELSGSVDASWNTHINKNPTTCAAGQVLIYNANGKWDLIGEPVSSSSINGKVNRAGDTMTGALVLAADPTAAMEAATKQYADTKTSLAYVTAQLATKQPVGDYALSSHTHAISAVTGLQTALDGKQPLDADITAIAEITGTSGLLKKTASNTWSLDTTSYSSVGHAHVIADVTGLQTALDEKAVVASSNTFTSSQVISVTDNTNAALRITQLGTGEALRVEDSTNPDSTPFVVASSGAVGIGSSSLAGINLRVSNQLTGSTTAYGSRIDGTIQSDVTSSAVGNLTTLPTQAAAFTLSSLSYYYASQGTLGAGSTVTNQFGFRAEGNLIDATNNYSFIASNTAAVGSGKTSYGFYAGINTATGGGTTYGFYSAGTAANFFAGDVGIGTNAPEYNLDIKSDDNVTTTTALAVQNSSRNYGVGIGAYQLTNRNIGGTAANVDYTFDIGGAAVFSTSGAERMRISANGNVGIGTSASDHKLNLAGNIYMVAGNGSAITWASGLGAHYVKFDTSIDGLKINGYANLVFETGSAIERMRIASSGYVGIGKASPACALDVAGGIQTSTHVATPSVPASTDGNIFSGTYVPTITTVANITSAGAQVSQYIRVGNVVTVSGIITGCAMTAAAGTSTVLRVTLPITSAMSNVRQLGGSGVFYSTASRGTAVSIYGDAANDVAEFNWAAPTTAVSQTLSFTFTYLVA